MSNIPDLHSPFSPPLTKAHDMPLHSAQYLSRKAFNAPPAVALNLETLDPVAAIDDGTLRVWLQQEQNREHEIAPTFAAAPHSEYFGSEVLSDGQKIHRHISYNVLRVLKNEENKQPFTVAGHEFVIVFEAPPPGVAWSREVPYPTDDVLRNEMMRLTPNDPPTDGGTGFPMHATKRALPMPTLQERLEARQVCAPQDTQKCAADRQVTQMRREAVRAEQDDDTASEATTGSLPSLISSDRSPKIGQSCSSASSGGFALQLPTTVDANDASARIDALTRDIEQRAMKVLKLDVNEEARNEEEQGITTRGLGQSICTMCLGPEHELAQCPQILADSGASLSLASLTTGEPSMFYFMDDLLIDPELIPSGVVAKQRPEVQQFLRTALAPTLEALTTLPTSETGRYSELMRIAQRFQSSYSELEDKLDEAKRGASRLASRELMKELEEAAAIFREAGSHVGTAISTASASRILDAPVRVSESAGTVVPAALTRDALATHTARLATPDFSNARGQPAGQDESSVSSSSNGNVSPYSLSRQPATLLNGCSSPANSEWYVPSNRHYFQPGLKADATKPRTLAQGSALDPHSEPSTTTDESGEASSVACSEPSDPNEAGELNLRPNAAAQEQATGDSYEGPVNEPFYQFRDFSPAERDTILEQWIDSGNEHMERHVDTEDLVCGAPLRYVLSALHQHLGHLLDYPAMEADGFARLGALSTAAAEEYYAMRGRQEEPLTMPLLQASTEDNRNLVERRRVCRKGGLRNDRPDGLDDPESAAAGSKRKVPSDEQRGEFQEGPRKRPRKSRGDLLRRTVINREAFKAAGILDEDTIRKLAGIRYGLKAAGRHYEDLAWHKYGIAKVWENYALVDQDRANFRSTVGLQRHFPDQFLHHPLLFDTECAKLQAIHEVLHEHGRYVLSTLLYDALTIRFKDEYAVSHLLNAGYLEHRYPAAYVNGWELIPEPTRTYYPEYGREGYFSDSASSSDSSDSSDSSNSSDWNPYPFELQYPDEDAENEPPVVISFGPITIAVDTNSEVSGPAPPYDAAQPLEAAPFADPSTAIEVGDDARFHTGDISVATRNAPFPEARLAAVNRTPVGDYATTLREDSGGPRPEPAARPAGSWDGSSLSLAQRGEIGLAF
ncbi:hypothetical protein B0H15DRAFT_801813 [Mycena belliarum]|uniref:Uncharacterized protein n=1 Tax=Mycena belliarum TaxID=1033014 RepID=A0AAD6U091_9AGAR|nr:hypothetical protein B0H15DRAFT_801813 [Mycena belliae]